MQDLSKLKYRAFLSYAHADQDEASRLHKRLEGFRLGKALAGRYTAFGPAPDRLAPIFRDREDFSGGQGLKDATIAALDDSAALIVLCSPVAASRPAVNEEVRLFRHRHPDRPVIPVILRDKAPGVFPPALRNALDADGAVTETAVDVRLGADMQPGMDGPKLALAKIASGVTGLPLVDVTGRMKAQDRQVWIRWSAVAAVIVAMVIAITQLTGTVSELSTETKTRAEEIAAIKQRLAAARGPDNGAPLTPEQQQLQNQAIAEIVSGNNPVAELLARGDLDGAREMLAAAARAETQNAAAKWRQIGNLFSEINFAKSWEAYEEAFRLDPLDFWTNIQVARFRQVAGRGPEAQLAVEAAQRVAKNKRQNLTAVTEFGKIAEERGDLPKARSFYEAALHEAKILSALQNDQDTLFDVTILLDRVANLDYVEGVLKRARQYYTESLEIRRQLADQLNSAEIHRAVLVSLDLVANLDLEEGNLQAARDGYIESLAIARRLDVLLSSPLSKLDVAVSLQKVADIDMTAGRYAAARAGYKESLEIDRQISVFRNEASSQRSISVMLEKIADVDFAEGDRDNARKGYAESLAIRRQLATKLGTDSNLEDLAIVLNKLAYIELERGTLSNASALFTESLTIRKKLYTSLKSIKSLSRMYESLIGIANVDESAGEKIRSRHNFAECVDIARRLVDNSETPKNLRNLGYAIESVARLDRALGEFDKARSGYEESLAIFRRISTLLNTHDTKLDLIQSFGYVSEFYISVSQHNAACPLMKEARQIAESLFEETRSKRAKEMLAAIASTESKAACGN